MNMKWLGGATLCMGLAFACGGGSSGSGVPGNTLLVDVTADEALDICQYIADLAGPERTVDCGNGTTVTIGGLTQADVQECASGLQMIDTACTATVGQAEACFEAIADLSDAELCTDGPPPDVCAPIFVAECN